MENANSPILARPSRLHFCSSLYFYALRSSAIRSERESAGGRDTLFHSAKANDTISPLIFTQVFLLSDVRKTRFLVEEQLLPWKRDGSNGG